jgi:type IV pilus assembly protein PilP
MPKLLSLLKNYAILYPILLGLLLISGCGDNSISDLEKYVAKIKAKENPHVDPIPEIKHIPPYFYEVQHMRDPFKPLEEVTAKLNIPGRITTGSGTGKGTQKKACPPPNPNRVRVGLELISLDTIKMIGTLETKGSLWALVTSSGEKTIYQVKTGDYIGEHHGKIIKISEAKMDVLEQIPDGEGCWKPRITTVSLFEY